MELPEPIYLLALNRGIIKGKKSFALIVLACYVDKGHMRECWDLMHRESHLCLMRSRNAQRISKFLLNCQNKRVLKEIPAAGCN